MSSFHTHRRRVHDEGLPPRVRHTNLRSCLVHFAPYGFRATYHHLCLSAGIPRDLEKDPNSVVRAVEELHQARQLWLADERAYADSRRAEKARGFRQVRRDHSWRGWQRGWGNIAYCPEPTMHPDELLSTVVEHVLRSSVPPDQSPAPTCRACGNRGNTIVWHDGAHQIHQLCGGCGVSLAVRRADEPDPLSAADHARRWKEIWRLRNESPRRCPG
ncbi:hypothetical protein [Streptomyces griseiscabiei]|uniref:GATA-type domain-containing protein n=1 Tax=Streptomyces griseiscabiei TaxID=2993540 RepID=A0ABU4KZ72_9ACTN|nr:hypothetical protein [Streptomyces griseiscabiei]MBZ3901117.1 hypothetical protein [Streptomyces griseiscabiei]MDX2908752.1 hypothetical protein [Streptomyces griseiscabiei]